MTNARLQLVFLGQLVDGAADAGRTRAEIVGAPIATDHQEELVLWHDLDADEARRVASRVQGLERQAAADHETVDEAPTAAAAVTATPKAADLTPFPVLDDIADEPPRKAPSQPTRRAPRVSKPLPPSAKPRSQGTAGSANEVRCPNCNTRQTMRVLCRGCASFLEVALKAKAERDAQMRAKARPGLFAMLGL
jgi:hypothetical protein